MSNINEMVLYEFSLVGAGLGGAARIAGTKALEWGLPQMATNAAAHGATGVSNAIGSVVPGLGSIVGGGLAAYQQHNINQLQDEYDRLRGIEPTSSTLGKGLKVAASTALGAVPFGGLITNIIQGSRLKAWQDKVDSLKNQIGYRNLNMGTPAPMAQPGAAQYDS